MEETDPNGRGCYDWVKVEGTSYCGSEKPDIILSEDREITVDFHTDRIHGETGFTATLWEGTYISVRHSRTLHLYFYFQFLRWRNTIWSRLLTIGVPGLA